MVAFSGGTRRTPLIPHSGNDPLSLLPFFPFFNKDLGLNGASTTRPRLAKDPSTNCPSGGRAGRGGPYPVAPRPPGRQGVLQPSEQRADDRRPEPTSGRAKRRGCRDGHRQGRGRARSGGRGALSGYGRKGSAATRGSAAVDAVAQPVPRPPPWGNPRELNLGPVALGTCGPLRVRGVELCRRRRHSRTVHAVLLTPPTTSFPAAGRPEAFLLQWDRHPEVGGAWRSLGDEGLLGEGSRPVSGYRGITRPEIPPSLETRRGRPLSSLPRTSSVSASTLRVPTHGQLPIESCLVGPVRRTSSVVLHRHDTESLTTSDHHAGHLHPPVRGSSQAYPVHDRYVPLPSRRDRIP